jgi:serine O-acetyltransferase
MKIKKSITSSLALVFTCTSPRKIMASDPTSSRQQITTLFSAALTVLLLVTPLSSSAWSPAFLAPTGRSSAPRRVCDVQGRITSTDDSITQYASSISEEDASDVRRPETDLKRLVSQIGRTSRTASTDKQSPKKPSRQRYQLGVGKNQPIGGNTTFSSKDDQDIENVASYISIIEPVSKPEPAVKKPRYDTGAGKNAPMTANTGGTSQRQGSYDTSPSDDNSFRTTTKTHLLTTGDEDSARLTRAVWDKDHFDESQSSSANLNGRQQQNADVNDIFNAEEKDVVTSYEQIDLSVPPSVYSHPSANGTKQIDLVWDLMRYEAKVEAAREPLLVSFLYSTIINHPTLESALAFHLANRLSNPAMLSTQIMSLIREALDADPDFRRNLRADILAVRDRDPACNCLPDAFLYFKGFHALQTYRVSHYLWKSGRRVLAHYLQSQVSQHFQIDIHPNATLGSGIMLDHGTGIVIGETAHLGHNCSVLHHVTLGGSGKKGVDRHPKVGNGVLLGAGASVLGNINIGDGCQVGAGTLVIEDLPPRSVAVGVPAKIIGRFVDVTAQPSIGMNQLGSKESDEGIAFYI